MSANDKELAHTVSAGQAIALGVTIVVGSGLLILPGLAYEAVGSAAFYAWAIDALIVIPLLLTFAYLGSRHPSAGGIAGFLQLAFGRRGGAATEVLLIGTFGLGIPGIAITGGQYAAAFFGGGRFTKVASTLLLLLLAGFVNVAGTKISARVQQVLAIALVALIALTAAAALVFAPHAGSGVAPLNDVGHALPAIGLIFFAFTGWEMLSFTAEEYRNPRRDFPLAIAGSFIIVVALYLLVALAVQNTLSQNSSDLTTAPLAAVLGKALGSGAGRAVAGLGLLIISANLVGAVWAASRLVFASAREGLLPEVLAMLNGGDRIPRNAVMATTAGLASVAAAHLSGLVTLTSLLQLAGQNFFILYGLTVLAFVKVVPDRRARVFGLATLVIVVATLGTFGWALIYPAALIVLGLTVANRGSGRSRAEDRRRPVTP